MSNGAESWHRSAVPHAVHKSGALQLSLRKDTSLLEGSESEVKFFSSNPSLKERDYIGLWESSSLSVQRVIAVANPDLTANSVDLHAKDTELSLGLGLSLTPGENGVKVELAQNGIPEVANDDCNVAQTNPSKSHVSDQILFPEQQHVTVSEANCRQKDAEQYSSAHDANGRGSGFSENVPLSSPYLAARTYVPQVSLPNRNGEQHLVSQRGCLQLQGKSYGNAEGIPSNSKQNDLSRQEAPHHRVNSQSLSAKSAIGGSDPRFAAHDVVVSTETGGPSYDASAAQKFWQINMSRPIEGYRSLSGQNANVADVALAPGRYAVPVPKVSTVPAKRPFFDAIGEHKEPNFVHDSTNEPCGNAAAAGAPTHGGLNSSFLGTTAIEGEVKYGASQAPKIQTASGFFPWTNVVQLPGGWQPTPAQFKTPPPPNVPTHEPASDLKMPAKPRRNNVQNEDSVSRSAVVGWPPIRSFRKNTLAAHAKLNDNDLEVAGEASTTHYVKVKLDGAKVQRKVDLNSCSSHESLKMALQDLFGSFIDGHKGGCNAVEIEKVDLVHGCDYVIAYEDFDGDLMLARDVPWEDFVTKVRKLRVMKTTEAKVWHGCL